ncbi:hypothetical protein FQN55_000472 [Onygenales sp. PD_40]|nr:hypothetical protein FQN55_000472 [Onygenales sp. PD_40]
MSGRFDFDGPNESPYAPPSDKGTGTVIEAQNYKFEFAEDPTHRARHAEWQERQQNAEPAIEQRVWMEERVLDNTEITIKSHFITKAFKEVVKEYPGMIITNDRVIIKGLFSCLWHYRKELWDYARVSLARGEADINAMSEIRMLLDRMTLGLRCDIGHYSSIMGRFGDTPGLDFDRLWMGYRPGDLMLVRADNECLGPRSFIGRLISIYKSRQCGFMCWETILERITWTDSGFRRVYHFVPIYQYDGFAPYNDLPVCPLEHCPDAGHISKDIRARARKFQGLCGMHQRFYRGVAQWAKDRNYLHDGHRLSFKTSQICSRILIDMNSFFGVHPVHFTCQIPEREVTRTSEGSLTDEDLLICCTDLPVYSLTDGRWAFVNVDNVEEIDPGSMQSFADLLLPQRDKDNLLTLTQAYTTEDVRDGGLIKSAYDKTRGMVVLLHGKHGVGKTTTVEAVSDHIQRPLLSIRCTDLDLSPSDFDTELIRVADLAARWKGIIHFEDADSFLQANQPEDNKLLALLQFFVWYDGIVFLSSTTPIETVHPAFRSKIHRVLQYEPLTFDQRRTLWRRFLEASSPDGLIFDDAPLDEFASHNFNGHQIRNMVDTACTIADNTGSALLAQHVRTALRSLAVFKGEPDESGYALGINRKVMVPDDRIISNRKIANRKGVANGKAKKVTADADHTTENVTASVKAERGDNPVANDKIAKGTPTVAPGRKRRRRN